MGNPTYQGSVASLPFSSLGSRGQSPDQPPTRTGVDGFWDAIAIAPTIVAGDPLGLPPDSADSRIDPNTSTSPFAGVSSVRVSVPNVGDFLGSGAAISRRHILTAAHVLDVANEDGIVDPIPTEVTVNFNVGGNLTQTITASQLQIFPDYAGFTNTFSNDLAIITLSSDLPDTVPIYQLHREALLPGSVITMVGYGTSGNGISGFEFGTASLSTKRVGYNVVEDFSLLPGDFGDIFLYDFDGPDSSTNLFGAIGSGQTLGNDIEANV
ncbi:MAG TPA: trypsin-like serine protease, partial [Chroococcidiopsis sp.]